MTNPAGEFGAPELKIGFQAGAELPFGDLSIDLGQVLGQNHGEGDHANIEQTQGSFMSTGGVGVGVGVEASFSAPGGIPQIEVGGGGEVTTHGAFAAEGQHIDAQTQTDPATAGNPEPDSETVIHQQEGGAQGFFSTEIGGNFGGGFSLAPTPEGLPGISFEADGGAAEDHGISVFGGEQTVEFGHDDGSIF